MISFETDSLSDAITQLNTFIDSLSIHKISSEKLYDAKLVSIELLSNVLIHLQENAHFIGSIDDDYITICVQSQKSYGFEIDRELPNILSESGRGLFLVKLLCDRVTLNNGKIEARIKIK